MTSEDVAVTYLLACEPLPAAWVEHTLEVLSDPPIELGLAVGAEVRLQSIPRDSDAWADVLTLRDAAGDLVAAQFSTGLSTAPPEVDVELFYAPLTFAAMDMSCAAVPYEDPNCGGMFIQDPCPSDITRLAVDYRVGNAGVRIWSDTVADLDGLRVRAHAELWEPIEGSECPFDRPAILLSWTALRSAT